MEKRLFRSRSNKFLAGVCGGIGEYLSIDPTVIRIGFLLFSLMGGSGILAYVLCLVIIPEQNSKY